MDTENKNLFYLDELSDYKVAENYPDVRGWEVKDIDNRTIGKVDGLLVSKSAEKVVYLDVEVDETVIELGHESYSKPVNGVHEFMNKDGDDHLIIPIGMVVLNEDEKVVHSKQINHGTFAKAGRFSKGTKLGREYESLIIKCYLPKSTVMLTEGNNDFYDRQEFKTK